MKVAVCFKPIADYSLMAERDWVTGDNHSVDTGFVRHIFNCYDESALELGLTLTKNSGNQQSVLSALTIDNDNRTDLFFKRLLAVGYDKAIRIEQDGDLRFSPEAVSLCLASFLQESGDYDLLLCGAMGGEGEHGITGLLLAEQLGLPCISGVTNVMRGEQDQLLVETIARNQKIHQVVSPPAVLVIGNSKKHPYLRVPTLAQKLAAKKKEISVVKAKDFSRGSRKEGNRLVGLSYRESGRECCMVEAENVHSLAKIVYEKYLKKRLQQ